MKNLGYSFFILFSFAFLSCSEKNKNKSSTIIPAENVMNVATAKKAKAEITGERKEIDVANEKINVWTIIYRDDKGNLHSTIIKQIPEKNNKVGDSLIIYYDETNPVSLPIYESQYLDLTK